MSSLTFKNEYASAVLTIWGDGNATLSNVFSRSRGSGYATRLMADICQHADDNSLTLVLVAQRYGRPSDDALTNKQLRAFYEKFGFVRTPGQRGVVSMQRVPSQEIHSI